MTREEAIKKIQGVLALAGSPNENEAKSAMLMAQKLLAKYHVSMAEVTDQNGEEKEEPIEQAIAFAVSGMRAWVRDLTTIVAHNFKCCCGYSGSKRWPTFVGYETDAETAKTVIELAVKVADRLGANLAQTYNDKGMSAKGVKESFCRGFVKGLKQAYEEQIAEDENCALMVIVPEKAQEEVRSWRSATIGCRPQAFHRDDNYEKGIQSGYDFANRRAIEG